MDIAGWAVSVMEALGAPGAGLLIALENLFPPLPSEVILPLAGFAASQGDLSLTAALFWTTAGSVAGAAVLYWIGALIGRHRLRRIVARMPLLKLSDVDRTEAWFARHGAKAVFFGRFVPIFRSLISIPAGVERMRFGTFMLYTTLGSAIWNTVFVVAGYVLGENWHVIEESVGVYSKIVLAVVAVVTAGFVVTRVRRNRRLATEATAAGGAERWAAAEQSPGAAPAGGAGRAIGRARVHDPR